MGEGRKSGNDQAATDPTTGRKLTVTEAAEVLRISADAVRSRIKRGTLETEKEGNSVFVTLRGGTSQANQSHNTGAPGDQSALIEALRDQIGDLRRERD